jgi:hypothetical protein
VTEKRALYFGHGEGGHFLRFPDGHKDSLDPGRSVPGFPWTIKHLDSGLLENRRVPDSPDRRVHWTCGGWPLWFAFFWWDRSGDKRGASNSGFYVEGFEPASLERESLLVAGAEAFAFAREQWPHIVARQLHPLVLVGGEELAR